MRKRDLEIRLQSVRNFADPDPALEQYMTPATMAADILEGKAKPADMAIQTQDAQKPLINLATAKAIGLTIPEEILKNAAVIEK